jgi:hypothetical protein
MRQVVITGALLLVARAGGAQTLHQVDHRTAARPEPVERAHPELRAELERVYQGMRDAIRKRDSVALRPLLTANYRFTSRNGAAADRATRMRLVATSTDDITHFPVTGCDVRPHGDAAIGACRVRVRERGTFDMADGSRQLLEGTVLSTVTFVRAR